MATSTFRELVLSKPPRLPDAARVYDPRYFDNLNNVLSIYFQNLDNVLRQERATTTGGGTVVESTFAWGDATPAAITVATGGKLITRVELHIITPFDGTGAAISVGDAGDADRLMTTTQNDPTTVACYDAYPEHTYAVDTTVLLTITPGAGATAGAGLLVISLEQ
jgi:hypothetical protein